MQIEDVSLTTLARTLNGRVSLRGKATVRADDRTMLEFSLSPDTIDTIQECVERDYDQVVRKIQCG